MTQQAVARKVIVIKPYADPEAMAYPRSISGIYACWLGCFGLLAWRYVPFLLRPRVDGKEH